MRAILVAILLTLACANTPRLEDRLRGSRSSLRDFDLSHPAVGEKMRERYGNRIPADEPVISPAAMFDAKELLEVTRR